MTITRHTLLIVTYPLPIFFKTAFKEFLIDESKQFLAADIDEKAIRDPDPEILCQKIAVAKCEEILKRRDEIPE